MNVHELIYCEALYNVKHVLNIVSFFSESQSYKK